MSIRKFYNYLFGCLLLSIPLTKGALPTPESIGQLLGYPGSELIIEDNTAQEKILIQEPSVHDQRRNTVLPDGSSLQKAYLIRGKNKDTFCSLQIYIGNKGTFLTAEALEEISKCDAMPAAHRIGGSEGFAPVGKGGSYFTRNFKVKTDRPPVNLPELVVALVTVVQPHNREFDVQIAQRLDQEIQPVTGGEEYYQALRTPREHYAKMNVSFSDKYLKLLQLVINGWLAENESSHGISPHTQPQSTSHATPSQQSVLTSLSVPDSTPSSAWWGWCLGGIALVVLAFVTTAILKRRH